MTPSSASPSLADFQDRFAEALLADSRLATQPSSARLRASGRSTSRPASQVPSRELKLRLNMSGRPLGWRVGGLRMAG